MIFVVSPQHEFTSSMKTRLEGVFFVTETENRCIHEITSTQISKNPQTTNMSFTNLNESTVLPNKKNKIDILIKFYVDTA